MADTHLSEPFGVSELEAVVSPPEGKGEENIKISGGHTIVEMMRKGMSPTDACLEALHRVARRVLRVEIDRGRLDLPLAVLEHQIELLPARAGDRRRQRGSRSMNDRIAAITSDSFDRKTK